MKRNVRLFSTLPIIFLFSIASCATLTNVWKDENYRGRPFKKIFVIAASPDVTIKGFLEGEVVSQLEGHETDSVTSSTFFPSHFTPDKESISSKIREAKAEAVLIMRFIKSEKEETYVPVEKFNIPTLCYDWYSYYSSSFNYIETPVYRGSNCLALMEAAVYDTKDEKLIWFARSRFEIPTCGWWVVMPFIKATISKLSSDQLIK